MSDILTMEDEDFIRSTAEKAIGHIVLLRFMIGKDAEQESFHYPTGRTAPLMVAREHYRRDLWALDNTEDRAIDTLGHIVLSDMNDILWRLAR